MSLAAAAGGIAGGTAATCRTSCPVQRAKLASEWPQSQRPCIMQQAMVSVALG